MPQIIARYGCSQERAEAVLQLLNKGEGESSEGRGCKRTPDDESRDCQAEVSPEADAPEDRNNDMRLKKPRHSNSESPADPATSEQRLHPRAPELVLEPASDVAIYWPCCDRSDPQQEEVDKRYARTAYSEFVRKESHANGGESVVDDLNIRPGQLTLLYGLPQLGKSEEILRLALTAYIVKGVVPIVFLKSDGSSEAGAQLQGNVEVFNRKIYTAFHSERKARAFQLDTKSLSSPGRQVREKLEKALDLRNNDTSSNGVPLVACPSTKSNIEKVVNYMNERFKDGGLAQEGGHFPVVRTQSTLTQSFQCTLLTNVCPVCCCLQLLIFDEGDLTVQSSEVNEGGRERAVFVPPVNNNSEEDADSEAALSLVGNSFHSVFVTATPGAIAMAIETNPHLRKTPMQVIKLPLKSDYYVRLCFPALNLLMRFSELMLTVPAASLQGLAEMGVQDERRQIEVVRTPQSDITSQFKHHALLDVCVGIGKMLIDMVNEMTSEGSSSFHDNLHAAEAIPTALVHATGVRERHWEAQKELCYPDAAIEVKNETASHAQEKLQSVPVMTLAHNSGETGDRARGIQLLVNGALTEDKWQLPKLADAMHEYPECVPKKESSVMGPDGSLLGDNEAGLVWFPNQLDIKKVRLKRCEQAECVDGSSSKRLCFLTTFTAFAGAPDTPLSCQGECQAQGSSCHLLGRSGR